MAIARGVGHESVTELGPWLVLQSKYRHLLGCGARCNRSKATRYEVRDRRDIGIGVNRGKPWHIRAGRFDALGASQDWCALGRSQVFEFMGLNGGPCTHQIDRLTT